MSKRIGGFRRKTRSKLKKAVRSKGKISLTRYFQELKKGDKVHLIAEPSIHKGMYHPRFIGKRGTIVSNRGRCYEVSVKDINKEKILIAHPIHLKKAE